jgi:glycerol-3-phosphate O-acyltransferase
VQRLADAAFERVKAVIPVTPVSLAAAALLGFERDAVPKRELLARMDDLRDHLLELNAKVVRADRDASETWERAMLMFRMRRTVVEQGETVIVMPRQRPLLEYYANAIAHLLPASPPPATSMTPAQDVDRGLFKLREPRKR